MTVSFTDQKLEAAHCSVCTVIPEENLYLKKAIDVDIYLVIEVFLGNHSTNGTMGSFELLISETDGHSWSSANGVCRETNLLDDYVQRSWSDYVVDPLDHNRYVHTTGTTTLSVTLSNDGIPVNLFYIATAPFSYTLNVTVSVYSNTRAPLTVFTLPQECVAMGFTCSACYSSGMMVASNLLFLMCVVFLQLLFHAL